MAGVCEADGCDHDDEVEPGMECQGLSEKERAYWNRYWERVDPRGHDFLLRGRKQRVIPKSGAGAYERSPHDNHVGEGYDGTPSGLSSTVSGAVGYMSLREFILRTPRKDWQGPMKRPMTPWQRKQINAKAQEAKGLAAR